MVTNGILRWVGWGEFIACATGGHFGIARLQAVFEVHDLPLTTRVDEALVIQATDTNMMVYIQGSNCFSISRVFQAALVENAGASAV